MDEKKLSESAPPGLTIYHGQWRVRDRVEGKQFNKSIGSIHDLSLEDAVQIMPSILQEFRERHFNLSNPEKIPDTEWNWEEQVSRLKSNSSNWLYKMYRKAKARDKLNRRVFDLSWSELKKITIQSKGRCALTGIPFSDKNPASSRVRPFMPSIDRIDNAKGYSKSNCRLVCAAVNLALMDFGEDVFGQISIGYAASAYARMRDEF